MSDTHRKSCDEPSLNQSSCPERGMSARSWRKRSGLGLVGSLRWHLYMIWGDAMGRHKPPRPLVSTNQKSRPEM